MKNYDDMSDFEINKAVMEIELRGQLIEYHEQEIDELADILGFDGRSSVVRFTTQLGSEQSFDGCNKPADAWPVIVENKISISHSIALYRADALVYDKRFDKGFKIFKQDSPLGDTSSRGALRAAMICFLKMNDGLGS